MFSAGFSSGKLALFDPAQAPRPAASRPVDTPIQACLIIAVNPVALRLTVHPAKPRSRLAAEAIEHHRNRQDARRLPGVRRSLGCFAQIGGAHIRPSNRNPSHLPPPQINKGSIDSHNGAEGKLP